MSHYKFSKELLSFIASLEQNNDRDWFNAHKVEYKTYEALTKTVFGYISEELNQNDIIDSFKVFRIYRDVRFSKNKLPYKTHISGSFQRKKPELRGGYYVHIQPNNKSFIGTGFWNPNKTDLLRVRREFEQDDEELRTIINHPTFKSVWGALEGDALKTAPRDFNKNHKAIDLIRKKQYIFTKHFTDNEVLDASFADTVVSAFHEIRPFFDYMTDVLTTNVNGESILK
jgi:uncharacterized protein (TIGR02453 family)